MNIYKDKHRYIYILKTNRHTDQIVGHKSSRNGVVGVRVHMGVPNTHASVSNTPVDVAQAQNHRIPPIDSRLDRQDLLDRQ